LSDERTDKLKELRFEWNLQKRKREDIEPQPLPPLAASINGNEENIHLNNNIVFENSLANEDTSSSVSRIRASNQGSVNDLLQAERGPIRNPEGCTFVLEESDRKS
jgi:hypothetical protein